MRPSELQVFSRKLAKLRRRYSERRELVLQAAHLLQATCDSRLIVLAKLRTGSPEVMIEGLLAPVDGLAEQVRAQFASLSVDCVTSDGTRVERLKNASTTMVIAVPLGQVDEQTEVLQLVIDSTPSAHSRNIACAELTAGAIRQWQLSRDCSVASQHFHAASAVVDLIAHVESAADIDAASGRLVDEIGEYLKGVRCLLGTCNDPADYVLLKADSDSASLFDETTERAIEAVFQESVLRDQLSQYPAAAEHERHSLLAHRRLASLLNVDTILSVPLRDNARDLQGVLIVTGDGKLAEDSEANHFLRAVSGPVGACLSLLKRTDPGPVARFITGVLDAWKTSKGRIAVAAAAVVCGILLLPMKYQVKCDCELQPVKRRFVAAPFDGPLETSLVEPGDIVTANELLARMDGREIRWELAGIEADRDRAMTERNVHMARSEFGASEISRLEMDRHTSRERMLRHRETNLEIRSPIAGLVIEGDWKKQEGVPLETGQSLFEIAPLDSMIVEVAIPEEDIPYVETGQDLAVSLDAWPSRTITGTVERIHVRSEVRENENIYVAEMRVPNPDDELRPGMQGRAKVSTVRRPLLWNLFHTPWNRFVMWMRYTI